MVLAWTTVGWWCHLDEERSTGGEPACLWGEAGQRENRMDVPLKKNLGKYHEEATKYVGLKVRAVGWAGELICESLANTIAGM